MKTIEKIRMTDSEIKKLWNNRGLSDRMMTKCLADLNACGTDLIEAKLIELGCLSEKLPPTSGRQGKAFTAHEDGRIVRLFMQGFSVYEISRILQRRYSSVAKRVTILRERGCLFGGDGSA